MEVFTLISFATEHVQARVRDLSECTDEAGMPIEPLLQSWTPDEGDLEVWRGTNLLFTLRGKHLHQISDRRNRL